LALRSPAARRFPKWLGALRVGCFWLQSVVFGIGNTSSIRHWQHQQGFAANQSRLAMFAKSIKVGDFWKEA
jgi:hypothetical protein